MNKPELTLSVLEGCYSVCRLPPTSILPPWVPDKGIASVTRTPQELSIVCDSEVVPNTVRAEHGFGILKIEGPLEFALTGILSAVAAPLADARISIFAISTFDTDYVLIKKSEMTKAVAILLDQGHQVNNAPF